MTKRVPLDRLREISKQRPIRRAVEVRLSSKDRGERSLVTEWPIEGTWSERVDMS